MSAASAVASTLASWPRGGARRIAVASEVGKKEEEDICHEIPFSTTNAAKLLHLRPPIGRRRQPQRPVRPEDVDGWHSGEYIYHCHTKHQEVG